MAAAGHRGVRHHLRLREVGAFTEAGHQVRYDEAARHILLLKHREYEAIPFGAARDGARPRIARANEGPVLNVRFAPPPLRWVAVQRSPTELELCHLDHDRRISYVGRPARQQGARARILSFHWTGGRLHDLVVLATWGADFLNLPVAAARPSEFASPSAPGTPRLPSTPATPGTPGTPSALAAARGLRPARSVALDVAWASYSHPTRLVVLASGRCDNEVHAMQLTPSGLSKVPRFKVVLPRAPLATVDRALRPSDLQTLCVDGRILLVHADALLRQLVPYELFRDSVVRRAPISLPVAVRALSQLDNLLVVHCAAPNPGGPAAVAAAPDAAAADAAAADAAAADAATPAEAPAAASDAAADADADTGSDVAHALLFDLRVDSFRPLAPPLAVWREAADADGGGGAEARCAQWALLAPNIVVDHAVGKVFELTLDLDALSATPLRLGGEAAAPEAASAAARARLPPVHAPAFALEPTKLIQLLLNRTGAGTHARDVLVRALRARAPARTLRGCFDCIHHEQRRAATAAAAAASAADAASRGGRQVTPRSAAAAALGLRALGALGSPAGVRARDELSSPVSSASLSVLLGPRADGGSAAASDGEAESEALLCSPPAPHARAGSPEPSAAAANASRPSATPARASGAPPPAGSPASPATPDRAAARADAASRGSVVTCEEMAEAFEGLLALCAAPAGEAEATVAPAALAASVVAYLRSADAHGVRADERCGCVLVRALVAAGREGELEQLLLLGGVLRDSTRLARALLDAEAALPSASEHALDMLHRLGPPARTELVALLVARGELVSARALVRAHGLPAGLTAAGLF